MNPVTIKSVLRQRLSGAIDSLTDELNNLPESQVDEDTKRKITQTLEKAAAHVTKGEFEPGWNQVFLAEQHLVRCMNEEQRVMKANNLRIEADEKVPGWRQKQIFTHLCKPAAQSGGTKEDTPSADAIIEAMKIRNDFINTRSNKILLKRASLNSLTLFLVGIISVIFICSFFVDLTTPPNQTWGILLALLFGALGASFSMAHTFATTGLENKIPDQLMGSYMIIIRLAIGGTAAFIINILLQAGLLDNFFSGKLINSKYSYMAISFLSGISERWVFNIIKSITKEKEAAEKK
jgi:hypothetical protein